MWYVYILRSADNSLYIGETDNFELRLARHNDARASVTAFPRPAAIAYSEILRFGPRCTPIEPITILRIAFGQAHG